MKNKPEGYAHLTAKIDQLKNQLVEAKAEIVRLKGKASYGATFVRRAIEAECKLDDAQAEIVRLTKRKNERSNGWDAALAQRDKLAMMLEKYGCHLPKCSCCRTIGPQSCICGFEKALKERGK